MSEAQMRTMLEDPIEAQLDVWQVAWAGTEVVGGVLGFIDEEENRTLGRARGYTELIFTRRPWRGRGIARAMIGRNLRELARRGMTEAGLIVDATNPSGALGLYQRVGFRRDAGEVTFQRPAPDPSLEVDRLQNRLGGGERIRPSADRATDEQGEKPGGRIDEP